MAKAVFDELKQDAPRNHFTVGIRDDVTHTSLHYDPSFFHRESADSACAFLRTGVRRNSWRKQEFHQDHRRKQAELRARLLRLRLEEGGVGHRFPLALRAGADLLDVPDFEGEFCGVSPILVPGSYGRSLQCGTWRSVSSKCSVRPQRSLGAPAPQGAAANHREKTPLLCD